MYLTSRQLWAIINPARRQAGLPPYKSFKIACSILQRNGCPTRKIDTHHTLYNAAAAISILTRSAKNREPLNTYTPPTTDAEIARLLKKHPRQKQPYTPSEKTHTQRATARAKRKNKPNHAQLARARQAAARARAKRQAEKAARREKTRRAALRECQRIHARRLHLHATTKATLRARGYIPLSEAFTLFNSIRATRNLAPYKTRNALSQVLITHHCHRLKATTYTYYYCAAHVEHIARTIQPRAFNFRRVHRRNFHPTASQEELDSGEYTTFKQFCALTGLPEYSVKNHALRHNFHAVQHPDTGLTLIHTATAAHHFLNHYQQA